MTGLYVAQGGPEPVSEFHDTQQKASIGMLFPPFTYEATN